MPALSGMAHAVFSFPMDSLLAIGLGLGLAASLMAWGRGEDASLGNLFEREARESGMS